MPHAEIRTLLSVDKFGFVAHAFTVDSIIPSDAETGATLGKSQPPCLTPVRSIEQQQHEHFSSIDASLSDEKSNSKEWENPCDNVKEISDTETNPKHHYCTSLHTTSEAQTKHQLQSQQQDFNSTGCHKGEQEKILLMNDESCSAPADQTKDDVHMPPQVDLILHGINKEKFVTRLMDISGGEFVIKSRQKNSKQNVQQIETEMRVMRQLAASPFIVDLYLTMEDETQVTLGMQYCQGGDLFSLLAHQDILSLTDVTFYAAEIALAIQHMHNFNILHADLKPENIGITASGHVRLLDFGLSVFLDEEGTPNPSNGRLEVITGAGTIYYSAPEILCRAPHGKESDWWSFGVLLYEMLYGTWPWAVDDVQATCELICRAPLLPCADDISTKSIDWDIVRKLLTKSRTLRLGYISGLDEVSQHPFFNCVDWFRLSEQAYLPPFSLQAE